MGFFDSLFDNAGVTLQSVAKNSFKFKTIIYIIGTVIGAIYFFTDYKSEIAFSIIVACVLIISTDYLTTVALVGLGKIVENAERQLKGNIPNTSQENILQPTTIIKDKASEKDADNTNEAEILKSIIEDSEYKTEIIKEESQDEIAEIIKEIDTIYQKFLKSKQIAIEMKTYTTINLEMHLNRAKEIRTKIVNKQTQEYCDNTINKMAEELNEYIKNYKK